MSTEELTPAGFLAVAEALLLLPKLEAAAIEFKLDNERRCIGLLLPEWTYQLRDPNQWSAKMTNANKDEWSISAVWVLTDQEEALISALPEAEGAGRVADYRKRLPRHIPLSKVVLYIKGLTRNFICQPNN